MNKWSITPIEVVSLTAAQQTRLHERGILSLPPHLQPLGQIVYAVNDDLLVYDYYATEGEAQASLKERQEEDAVRCAAEELASEGAVVFWRYVAGKFPESRGGDLTAGTVYALESAMVEAIEEWITLNVPRKAATV